MNKITDFIIEYIQREYTIPDNLDVMSLNFVDEGYIDSMALIQFIATIEDEFGITFSDDELASDSIKVVGSLVSLINSKIGKEN